MTAIAAIPLLVPALGAALLFALLVSRRLASRLRTTRGVAWLLVAGAGLVLAATVTPGLGDTYTPGVCTLAVDGGVLRSGWLRDDVTRNLLLTVPLGLALGRLPRRRRAVPTLAAVALLPLVEVVQMLAPALGRACQATDLLANAIGLAAGVLAGLLYARLTRPRRAVIVKVTAPVNGDLDDTRPLAGTRR